MVVHHQTPPQRKLVNPLLFSVSAVLCLAIPALAVEKWALLIGVNDYTKGPAAWDLRGCENDVKMTEVLLTTKFGFPKSNIKTLINHEATAAGIVAAMENWLIDQVQVEDIVYFHFSGHGSQTKDRDGDEDDGKDELLCPSDMQLGDIQTVITDDQLRDLFARIRSNNVTIVIDACHSGTATRDLSLSRARFVDFEGDGGGVPGTRAAAMTQTPGTSTGKANSKLAGTGGMESCSQDAGEHIGLQISSDFGGRANQRRILCGSSDVQSGLEHDQSSIRHYVPPADGAGRAGCKGPEVQPAAPNRR